jgi:hypothetical protein
MERLGDEKEMAYKHSILIVALLFSVAFGVVQAPATQASISASAAEYVGLQVGDEYYFKIQERASPSLRGMKFQVNRIEPTESYFYGWRTPVNFTLWFKYSPCSDGDRSNFWEDIYRNDSQFDTFGGYIYAVNRHINWTAVYLNEISQGHVAIQYSDGIFSSNGAYNITARYDEDGMVLLFDVLHIDWNEVHVETRVERCTQWDYDCQTQNMVTFLIISACCVTTTAILTYLIKKRRVNTSKATAPPQNKIP